MDGIGDIVVQAVQSKKEGNGLGYSQCIGELTAMGLEDKKISRLLERAEKQAQSHPQLELQV